MVSLGFFYKFAYGKWNYVYEVLSQMTSLLISLKTNTVSDRQSPSCPPFGIGEIKVLRF